MRFVLLLAAAVIAMPAVAQPTCPPQDLAQYKLLAQSLPGRMELASQACRLKLRQAANERSDRQPVAQQCGVEIAKLRDVLEDSGDKAGAEYMRGGCRGAYPTTNPP
jgi:hypothetical protein